MVASFTHVFLLAEKILKSRSFVLNIYRKNVLAVSIKLLTVRGEPSCGFVNIVDMKTMKPQRSAIIVVTIRDDNIGDSGDNKDSEDLIFDDEGI